MQAYFRKFPSVVKAFLLSRRDVNPHLLESLVQVHPPAAEKNPFAIKDGNWKSPISRDVDGTIIYSIRVFPLPRGMTG